MQKQETIDQIHKILPKATDDEINEVLWSQTSYPFGTDEYILKQIQGYIDQGPVDGFEGGHHPWDEKGCPFV